MTRDWWKPLVLPAGLIAAAEIAMRVHGTTSMSLAAPSEVLIALGRGLLDGSILGATAQTLATSVGGLALGGGIGLALGILFGLVRPVNLLMEVPIEAVRPVPSVAILPIALLVFGFGYSLEIAIVAFSCIWPVMIITRAALGGVEPRLLEVARALRLSLPERIVKIIFPAALPRIIVAFRLAAAVALIVAVTVEIAVNPLGLGYGMLMAQHGLRPALMLAYLVWIGVLGWSLNALLSLAQHHLANPNLRGAAA